MDGGGGALGGSHGVAALRLDCCGGWGWAAAGGRACGVPVGRRQGGNGWGGRRNALLCAHAAGPCYGPRWRTARGAVPEAVWQRAPAQHVFRSLSQIAGQACYLLGCARPVLRLSVAAVWVGAQRQRRCRRGLLSLPAACPSALSWGAVTPASQARIECNKAEWARPSSPDCWVS